MAGVSARPRARLACACLAVVITLFCAADARVSVTDLTAAPVWTLANANGSVSVSGAALPAYVLEVLEDRKLIQSPLLKYNERELNWVRDDTWTFSRDFDLPTSWPGGELVLAGVDTVADVALNGRSLGRVANEFRTHRFAVSPGDLKSGAGAGSNRLEILLKPVKAEAEKLQKDYSYYVPSIAHVGSFAEHKGFIRKAGSDFGWDWGPALGPVGVHGAVYLLAAAPSEDAPGAAAKSEAAPAAAASASASYLQAAHLRQRHSRDSVRVTAHLVVARPSAGGAAASSEVKGTARVAVPELGIDASKEFSGSEGQGCAAPAGGPAGRLECDVMIEFEVPKDKIELWWPAGHGKQKLYATRATWAPAGAAADACAAGQALNTDDLAGLLSNDSKTSAKDATALVAGGKAAVGVVAACSAAERLLGFRTVELVTTPPAEAVKELAPGAAPATGGDAEGETMYLRVNGVPMFLKGANLIPLHIIRTKVTEDLMMGVLKGALDVNMNVLRVWGGGIYQPDAFYTACDKMGIMVWQEAMFACAMYPADDQFLSDVRQEMREQVLRIGHHPSLAVWGGNNENEVGFGWFPEAVSKREFFTHEYIKLYFDTVGDEVTKLDPERPFIDSSPANGPFYAGADADGRVAKSLKEVLAVKRWGDAGDKKFGDVHFYDNINDCTAPGKVPIARMMSEFGWQSDAPYFSIKAVTDPQDWNVWSKGAQYRQRWNTEGTKIKTTQMGRLFGGLPDHGFAASDPKRQAQLYGDWIYLRQLHQAVCMDHAISLLRRSMRDPRYLSMGTLYWQLNDVWQGASWSTFDYEQRWKPAHHAMATAYAPVQVQALASHRGDAEVYLAYDEARPLPAPVVVDLFLHSLLPEGDAGSSSSAKDAKDAPAGAARAPLSCAGVSNSRGAPVGSFRVDAGQQLTSGPAWSMRIDELLKKRPGCKRDTCYLRAAAREAAPGAGDAKTLERRGDLLGTGGGEQEAIAMLSKLRNLTLPEVAVKATAFKKVGPKTVTFKITSAGGPAVFAYWDAAPAGKFSVNNVHVLEQCKPLTVTFNAVDDVDAKELENTLTIWTVNGALLGKQRDGGAAVVLESGKAASVGGRVPRPLRAGAAS